jgi:hypothetical protein
LIGSAFLCLPLSERDEEGISSSNWRFLSGMKMRKSERKSGASLNR